MWITLLGSVLGSVGDSVIKALFGLITAEMDKRNLLAQGAQNQATAETAVSAKTEIGIAAAEANAPKTVPEIVGSMKNGTF